MTRDLSSPDLSTLIFNTSAPAAFDLQRFSDGNGRRWLMPSEHKLNSHEGEVEEKCGRGEAS
jgi:hypothetical protein